MIIQIYYWLVVYYMLMLERGSIDTYKYICIQMFSTQYFRQISPRVCTLVLFIKKVIIRNGMQLLGM